MCLYIHHAYNNTLTVVHACVDYKFCSSINIVPNHSSSCNLDLSTDNAFQDLSSSYFQDIRKLSATPSWNEEDVTEIDNDHESESKSSSFPSPAISNFSSTLLTTALVAPANEHTHKCSESQSIKSTVGVKLVFDNTDKMWFHGYDFEKKTKSLHYVQMYGVRDRINIDHL